MDAPRILFVDDEVSVLNSLRRGLRLHCRDWQVEFCNSAADALILLPEFEPWVVVSDKRMPGMNGADFLRAVSRQSPEVVRVLLTGDTSSDVAFEVADIAHMLISKPFKIETLIQLLHRAKCLRGLPASLAIRKQLGSIERIPVLPKIYQQLVGYLKKDMVDTREVARIISQDPYILAKLMQLANSAFFGFSSQVSNVHEAVIRLGIELIKNLVLCFGVFKQCDSIDDRISDQLFVEAIGISMLSRQLSLACGCRGADVDDSFVLGLLHNVGMLMSGMSIIQLEVDDSSRQPREENVVGAYLLALWEFETEFVNAILYQDNPEDAENVTSLCCRLHVVKVVDKARKQGVSALEEQSGLNQSLLLSQGLLDDVILWINQLEA